MASLFITEIEHQGVDQNGRFVGQPSFPPVAEQKITLGATSAQSATLNEKTTLVRLHSDGACHVAVAVNPTATNNNMHLAANQAQFIAVRPKSGLKIAVITP